MDGKNKEKLEQHANGAKRERERETDRCEFENQADGETCGMASSCKTGTLFRIKAKIAKMS